MTQEALEKRGITDQETIDMILETILEAEERAAALEEEKAELTAALEESRKQAAAEKAILERGGKNAKAILALLELSKATLKEDGTLEGLELERVKEEAPYLFYEKEEKRKGTGMTRGEKKKENEISAAFKKGLRR